MSCVSWVSFARPLSRNHAKHQDRAHLVFLPTFSQLLEHSVESRKESSQCSVIYFWVLLVRAFQFKFFIQLRSNLPSLGRNTCPLQVFRAPTQWFRKYHRFSFNGSLAEVWILKKKTVKTSITLPPIAVEASTTNRYAQILCEMQLFYLLFLIRSNVHWTY